MIIFCFSMKYSVTVVYADPILLIQCWSFTLWSTVRNYWWMKKSTYSDYKSYLFIQLNQYHVGFLDRSMFCYHSTLTSTEWVPTDRYFDGYSVQWRTLWCTIWRKIVEYLYNYAGLSILSQISKWWHTPHKNMCPWKWIPRFWISRRRYYPLNECYMRVKLRSIKKNY